MWGVDSMANVDAAAPGLWGSARRQLGALRRMLLRALTRARDLQGGAAEDTRTGEGRRVEGVGGAGVRKVRRHPILEELRWRAACELLEHLGALTAPRQLRAHVETVGDPVEAVRMLAEDLGCDVDKLRAGDALEQDLFLERVEMLVGLDRIRDAAPRRFKELVVRLFHDGQLSRLRLLAETRRNLQTALGFCDDIREQRVMASVERLRGEIAQAIADVEHVNWEESDESLRAASRYMRVAEQLAAIAPRWNTTLKETMLIWPGDWRAMNHPRRTQLDQLDRRGLELIGALTGAERLTPEAAEEAVGSLEKALEALETLLADAHEHALKGPRRERTDWRTHAGPNARPETVNDWLRIVGLSAGARPSAQELGAAYRAIMKKIYPRVNAGDPTAEELVKHINSARDKLKAYFGYK